MANEFKIKNGFLANGDSEITGSLIVTEGISGSFSGSFQGDGSQLTGISSDNIYTADGSLTGDRTVDLNANSLTFANPTSSKKLSLTSSTYSGTLKQELVFDAADWTYSPIYGVGGRTVAIYQKSNDTLSTANNLILGATGTGGQILFGTGTGTTTASIRGNFSDNGLRIGPGVTESTAALEVEGFGSTSATTALLVENSSATQLLKIDDAGVFALGRNANAEADNRCVTIGLNANTNRSGGGSTSVCVGGDSTAIGVGSLGNNTSVGYRATTTGGNGIALGYQAGYNTPTHGSNYLIIGQNAGSNQASIGTDTILIGNSAKGISIQGVGIGPNITLDGNFGVILGRQNTVSTSHGIALGHRVQSTATRAYIIGSGAGYRNNSTSNSFEVNFDETTSTFRFGQTADGWLNSTGNFGIGTTTPQAKLHVSGTLRIDALEANPNINVLGQDVSGFLVAATEFSGSFSGSFQGDGSQLTGISSDNIYTADGSLTGDRTVDLNGNKLNFSTTPTGYLVLKGSGGVFGGNGEIQLKADGYYNDIETTGGGPLRFTANSFMYYQLTNQSGNRITSFSSGITIIPTSSANKSALLLRGGTGFSSTSKVLEVEDNLSQDAFFITNDRVTHTKELNITGLGSTSATTSLLVENSSATQLLKIDDAGAFMLGVNASSNSSRNVAIGQSATATTGTYGIAIGYNSVAGGIGTAIGLNTDAGTSAVAIGENSQALGTRGTALGYYSEATGDNVAIGGLAKATGIWSTALGFSTSASAQESLAIGRRVFATANSSYIIGVCGTNRTNSTANSFEVNFDEVTPTFKFGQTADGWLNSTGNFGIGTTTPQAKLHVSGTLRIDALEANPNINVLGQDVSGSLVAATEFSGSFSGSFQGDGSQLTGISSDNIYTADDSLTGDRTVDLNAFGLTFNKNYSSNKNFRVESFPYSVSYANPYFNIDRYGAVDIAGSNPTTNDAYALSVSSGLASQSYAKVFGVGLRGGGRWDGFQRGLAIGDLSNATWLYGMYFHDGQITISNGANWNDNPHHILNMRNNTSPKTLLHQLGQGSMVIGGSSAISGEFLSIQGHTLIQGQGSTSATTALEIKNSSATQLLKIDDAGGFALGLGASYGDKTNVSIGDGASASNTGAIAIGDGATSTSLFGVGIGGNANTGSGYNVVIGYNASASTTGTAIGYSASATSGSSLAVGSSASSGASGVALGKDAVNAGYGVALGFDAQTTLNYGGLAVGNKTRATGNSMTFSASTYGAVRTNSTVKTAEFYLSATTPTFRFGETVDGWLNSTGAFGFGTTTPDSSAKVDISATDKGLLIPRVTTAQMNAISTPATNLLVFNTDLEALYRYDGANWVALSAGYGVIEVITDADSGVPTYFADLQSALETCKTSGSNNVVRLCSDISLSAQIDINSSGTGTGNGYAYKALTINFNGFSVTFDDVGGTDNFNVSFLNSSTNDQTLTFLNGYVYRLNGDGTDYVLHFPSTGVGSIEMSKMYWYCQNGGACRVLNTAHTQENAIHDFGGSLFVSEGSVNALDLGTSSFQNFKCRNTSSGNALSTTGDITKNFVAIADGAGVGAFVRASNVMNFYCYSESGKALELDNDSKTKRCSHFMAESNSGYAIYAQSNNDTLSNFNAYSNSSTYACWFVSSVEAKYGKIVSNSGYGAYVISSKIKFVDFTSISGAAGCLTRQDCIFEGCNFTGEGGLGIKLTDFGNLNNNVFKNCNFTSDYNNASGHSVEFDIGTGTAYFMNCTFQVTNASANCLYSASAVTVSVGNSGYIGATTPENANVTVSLTSAPDSNGNYTA